MSELINNDPATATFYDPRVFQCLGEWIRFYRHFLLGGSVPLAPKHIVASRWAGISPVVFSRVLEKLLIFGAILRARDSSKFPSTQLRHFENWFGGLKTLRFIHELTDIAFPMLEFRESLERAPFLQISGSKTLDSGDLLEQVRNVERRVLS